jgi:diacylglycerol kinase family enzyme
LKVILVHNPDAGESANITADHLLRAIGRAGHTARYQSTNDQDWHKALDAPTDIIAVAGGDGIVGRVAKQCAGRERPIAILPLGIANNIAHCLGLTDVSLNDLVGQWRTAPHETIDLAWATGPWGSRPFIEGMGVGLFADLMSKLDARGNIDLAHLKSAEDKVAWVQKVLRNHLSHYTSFEMKVFLDGRDLSGEFILLEALNIQFIGPNLHFAPHADPTDGLLDLALFYEGQQEDLIHQLVENGRETPPRPTPPRDVLRGRLLEIEFQRPPIHIDDEVWPEQLMTSLPSPVQVTVSVKRNSIAFLGRNHP